MLGLAGEYRADDYLFDTCCFDCLTSCLTDLFSGSDDEVTVIIMDIMHGNTTEDTEGQGRDGMTVSILDSARRQTTEGTTVLLIDDDIMRYIDETTGEVTGIGGLQSGIRQTLTGTVGRDEVLEHGHTLFEVREDRVLDFRTCIGSTCLQRLGHNTTDTGELLDLLLVTTGTGVHHHVNGVESVIGLFHVLHQDVLQVLIDFLPCIDGSTITLIVRQHTVVITLVDLIDIGVTLLGKRFLLLGNEDIVQVEAQSTLESAVVTEVLDIIEELRRTSHTAGLDDL